MSGVILPDLLRAVQAPLLGLLLIGGGAAKAQRMLTAGLAAAGSGPTVLFPAGLRRPAAVTLCAGEFLLGAGLLLTAGQDGPVALAARSAAALLFCIAAGALHVLRQRQPEAGCGCFGELSRTPVSGRVIGRALLLGLASVWSVGAPPLHQPGSPARTGLLLLALGAAELAALAALSPEAGQLVARLSRPEPCELRAVPVGQTLDALHESTTWRRHQRQLTGVTPVDVWREGCWRFVVYPGELNGRPVELIFAVQLDGRRPLVRFGLLDVTAGPAEPDSFEDPLQLSNRL